MPVEVHFKYLGRTARAIIVAFLVSITAACSMQASRDLPEIDPSESAPNSSPYQCTVSHEQVELTYADASDNALEWVMVIDATTVKAMENAYMIDSSGVRSNMRARELSCLVTRQLEASARCTKKWQYDLDGPIAQSLEDGRLVVRGTCPQATKPVPPDPRSAAIVQAVAGALLRAAHLSCAYDGPTPAPFAMSSRISARNASPWSGCSVTHASNA